MKRLEKLPEKISISIFITTLCLSLIVISYPWKKLLKSVPLWTFVNEHFSSGFLFAFIMFSLPLYVKDVHKSDIQEVGFISAIPLISSTIGELLSAFIMDFLKKYKIMKTRNIHKAFIFIGQSGSVVTLLLIGLRSADFETSILLFSVNKLLHCFGNTALQVLPMDMFSRYASLVRAIGYMGYGIASILSPTIMGFMVPNHTRSEWNYYFLILSAFSMWGMVIFLIFGSAEVQPWVTKDNAENEDEQVDVKSRVSSS